MKRSRTAALLVMSAVPLVLSACAESETSSEGLYTSVEECIAQTNDSYNCQQAHASATEQAVASSPRYATREECIAAHGADQCNEQRDASGHSFFMPFMTGFLMAQMFRGGQPVGLASSPAYRNPAGNWQRPAAPGGVYRPGVGGSTAMVPVNAKPNVAPTTSRGGFGANSSQRASSSNSSGG